DIYFVERLRKNSLTESDFIRLLGEPSSQLQQRFQPTPAWLRELESIYTAWTTQAVNEQEEEIGELGFLFIARPLIQTGRERLRAGIEQLQHQYQYVPFEPQSVENLIMPNLFIQLSQLVARTMVLELNVARVEERLRGETPEERFQDFIRQ